MTKIKELTKEQEAQLQPHADMWIKIGLSTEPVDFEEAKKYARLAYQRAGVKEPTKFYLVDGPLAAIKLIKELDPSKSEKTIFNEMCHSSHDASWLSFYDFFATVVGIEFTVKIDGLIGLAKNSGWVSLYEDTVVIQQRPELIKFDDQNRLHCETGPAIRYRDGLSVYSWHGVTIPKEWIENKATALTPKVALTWSNIEQRRCACEILGWANILRELNSTVIDSDADPMIGDLLEVEIPEIGREKFLQVVCGTGRTFAIPVPPNMKTALEANAWTYNLKPIDLRDLEVRT